MSGVERRRWLRAFMAAPHEMSDAELAQVLKTCRQEEIRRCAAKVTWETFCETVSLMTTGGPGRLVKALKFLGVEVSLEGVLSSAPWQLLTVDGFGTTTVESVFLSMLVHMHYLPASWEVAPDSWSRQVWREALDVRDQDPSRLKVMLTNVSTYTPAGRVGLARRAVAEEVSGGE